MAFALLRASFLARYEHVPESGYVMVVVMLAGLLLAAASVSLVTRSSNSLLVNNNFGDYRLKAQDAAETGVNRIISELNKPANRGLLRSSVPDNSEKGSASSPALWASADVAKHRNRCPGVPAPSFAANAALAVNLGYPSTNSRPSSYNLVYLKPDGTISSGSMGADRAYQLLATTRYPEEPGGSASPADTAKKLSIFNNAGKSEIVLVVKGWALDSAGNRQSAIVLKKSFELVPKCCGASFGGSHGNAKYHRTSEADNFNNPCLDLDPMSSTSTLGLGLLAGLDKESTGSIAIAGSMLITDGTNQVSTIYCLATSGGRDCANSVAGYNQSIQISTLNPRPRGVAPAPEFPQDSSRPNGTLSSFSISSAVYSDKPTSRFLRCKVMVSAPAPCPSAEIHSDVTPLPDFCNLSPANPPVQSAEVLHCRLSSIVVSSNQSLYFVSGKRRMRFYLTSSGTQSALQMTGNAKIYHCGTSSATSCSQPDNVADLSFFGCNGCSGQNISLVGSTAISSDAQFFAYFPRGSVGLAGDSYYKGILWAHTITSAGNVTWVIPGSGLSEVLYRMDMLPRGYSSNGDNYSSADKNPILYDYAARSVTSFSWMAPGSL